MDFAGFVIMVVLLAGAFALWLEENRKKRILRVFGRRPRGASLSAIDVALSSGLGVFVVTPILSGLTEGGFLKRTSREYGEDVFYTYTLATGEGKIE